MSQITGRKFAKRNDQHLDEQYFEDVRLTIKILFTKNYKILIECCKIFINFKLQNIYRQFVKNVQTYFEVLQPVVLNVNNAAKNVGKFSDKFSKVNPNWIFDSETLQNAKVTLLFIINLFNI